MGLPNGQHNDFTTEKSEGMTPERLFWMGLIVLTAWRLIYLAFTPLELVGDEAYYWDWGRQLDWGYYSKPPMIGWLMGLAGWVGGDTAFGVRMFAVFFGSGTLICLFLLTRRMFDSWTALWAVAAIAATPANAALNLVMTIDPPLLFCWALGLYLFWRIVSEDRPSAWLAVALTIVVGLGLLTKQMMLVFYLLVYLFLLFTPEKRSLLGSPWLWVGSVVSLAFLTPPLWWNAQNDWITFAHTSEHFSQAPQTPAAIAGRLGEFVLFQAGIFSPVTWALVVAVLFMASKRLLKLDARARLLWLFSMPGLITVALMVSRQRINPNWPAVFYVTAMILLAAWFMGRFDWGKGRKLRKAFKPGLMVGAGLAAIAYLLPLLIQWSGLGGTYYDIAQRLNGWRDLAAEVQTVREELPRPDETFIYTVGHRYTASQLAFYLPDQPRTYRWEEPGVTNSQYEIWGGPYEAEGWDALIVVSGRDGEVPEGARALFASVEELKRLEIPLGPESKRPYALYLGRDYRGGEE